MALLFVIGYAGIIFEESLAFNKSGVALLMAVSLWVVRSIGVRMILRCLILCVSLLSLFLYSLHQELLFISILIFG